MTDSLNHAFLATQKRRVAQKLFRELDTNLARYQGQTIALAVSGGLDSRALLEAVASWPSRHAYQFLVVTVNHHTRPECGSETAAVVARAKCLGFDAEIVSLFPSKMDEAALREGRYSAISNLLQARKIRLLCTAHQKDDDAEGVIMDLFGLGGGAHGAGIKRERSMEFGSILRPFLSLQRHELLLFLTAVGATDYFCDPNNENGSSARQKSRDFLRSGALKLHPKPTQRLASVAQSRTPHRGVLTQTKSDDAVQICFANDTTPHDLRLGLQEAYRQLCPEKDPRNATPGIEIIVKKAISCDFIATAGVDPGVNSITLSHPERLNFDLPGAKASMAPGILSLYRNHRDLLVQ